MKAPAVGHAGIQSPATTHCRERVTTMDGIYWTGMHGGIKTQARINQGGVWMGMHVELVGYIAQREEYFGTLYH